MNDNLEEFLERFVGVEKIVIFNRKENIEDDLPNQYFCEVE